MSKKLIELDDILIEVESAEVEAISGGSDVIEKIDSSMDSVKNLLLKSVKPISEAYAVLNQDVVLERAEVEIGVGFSAEGNIFIAKGKASTNLKIKLILSPKVE